MSYIIAIGLYLVLLMVYGLVIAHKKVKTTDDMMTGGHKIPFIILVGHLVRRRYYRFCRSRVQRRTLGRCADLCRPSHRHHPAVLHCGQGPQVKQGDGA